MNDPGNVEKYGSAHSVVVPSVAMVVSHSSSASVIPSPSFSRMWMTLPIVVVPGA